MSEPTTTTAGSPDYSRSFFGHPRGLATLFMTEFFERFTYYGLRAMLVLFLAASATGANPGFGVDGATAGAVYALFTGAAYLCCMPGGWIADRLLGQRSARVHRRRVHRDRQFHPGHSRYAAIFYHRPRGGRARHRPAEAERLECRRRAVRRPGGRAARRRVLHLLHGHQPRRGRGSFTRAGRSGEGWNWRLGFLRCGLAMLIGLAQFKMTRKYLGTAGMRRRRRADSASATLDARGRRSGVAVLIVAPASCVHARARADLATARSWLFIAHVAIALASSATCCFSPASTIENEARRRHRSSSSSRCAMFWGGFEQQATTFNMFADRLHRSPCSAGTCSGAASGSRYQCNPTVIIVFAPFFAGSGCSSARAISTLPRRSSWALGLIL